MVSRGNTPEYKGRSNHGSQDEQQVVILDDEETETDEQNAAPIEQGVIHAEEKEDAPVEQHVIQAEEQEDVPVEQDVIHYSGPKEVLYGSEAEKFCNPKATLWAFKILKRRWTESWMSWRDIPYDERERQWEYFLRRYSYTDEHQGTLLRRTWEATVQRHVTQILSQTHKVAKMETESEDISAWVDSQAERVANYVWLQMMDNWNIDTQKDKSQVTHSNHHVEGGLTNHNNDTIPNTNCNCMFTSQEKLPTQADLCDKTHMKNDTDEFIDTCLRQVMDDFTTSFKEKSEDIFSHQVGVDLETWLKVKTWLTATTDLEKNLYKPKPNDACSNFRKTNHGLRIYDSPRVQSQSRLSQQDMRKMEQAVETMLKLALNSFSDNLMPHIAKQIHDSLRGKGPITPEDDEKEDEDDE